MKRISGHAFRSCVRLKEISFTGTKDQWNAIKKTNIGADNCTTIHCIDGDLKV